MSKFQELIDQLAETDALVGQLKAAGDDDFIRLNLVSIQARRDQLSIELDNYLSVHQRAFMTYRIVRAGEQRYAAKAVGGALQTFQDLLTSVYDAVLHGPKKRFRPTHESVQETLLEFGGATAGSVQIFLAADEERLLVDDSNLQRALVLVEKTLSARTTDDLTRLSEEVGVASIAKAYAWAGNSVENGFGTDFRWGQRSDARNEFHITHDEAGHVRSLIAERSDEVTEMVSHVGILHGFDKETSYFHFVPFETKDHIKGEVAASVPQKVTTGTSYLAKMALTTITFFSTGEEKQGWTLMSLESLDDGPSMLERPD